MKCVYCDSYEVRKHQSPSEKNNFRARYHCVSCKKYFALDQQGYLIRRNRPHLSLNATKIWQQYVFEGLSFERIASLHNTSLASTIKAFLMKNQDPDFTHTFYNNRIYKRIPNADTPNTDTPPTPTSSLLLTDRPIKKAHEIGVTHPCPVCNEGVLHFNPGEYNEDINLRRMGNYSCSNCNHQTFSIPTYKPIHPNLIPHVIKLFNEKHMNIHHIAHNLFLSVQDVRKLLKHENGKYPAGW